MSHTYKYPKRSAEDVTTKEKIDARLRIIKKLLWHKQLKTKKKKISRSFKKYISFRDKQRART